MEDIIIGSLKVFPVFMAPMAGITDSVFRDLVRSMGCGLAFSEMISVKGLLLQGEKTRRLLPSQGEESPLGIQIFGSSPKEMAKGALFIQREYNPDLIDINMGCPVKKVVKTGAGAALLKDPKRAIQIVKAVTSQIEIPLTVKLRAGWDHRSINAPYLAPLLEEAGAKALVIHGRTREDFYQGRADWKIIKEVKESTSIPVIGNGDIFSKEDFSSLIQETCVDGVMIGRGALGNPWIFRDIKGFLAGQEYKRPSIEEKMEMVLRHLQLLTRELGEVAAVQKMRKHCSWYLKGLPRGKALKVAINKAKTNGEMVGLLKSLGE